MGRRHGKVESFQPDLIIMDLSLPDESGLDLTKKIRITNSDIKVVILSGHDYPNTKRWQPDYGADAFLVKGAGVNEIFGNGRIFFSQMPRDPPSLRINEVRKESLL